MDFKKICSSDDLKSLLSLINEYYYSKNCFINEDLIVGNLLTGKSLGKVIKKGYRYTFYTN